jgi:hypothetical protein
MTTRTESRVLWVIVACAALAGCSGDDDAAAEACPEGTDAGAEVACDCEDAGSGVQVCGDDGNLGECDCGGESSGGSGTGSGRAGSGGNGGRSGSGGSGGRSGNGGSTGSAGDGGSSGTGGSDEDGGVDPGTTDGGAGTDAGGGTTLPTDGDQLSVCEGDSDCDTGFSCFMEGGGQHFCTADCENTADCEGIEGANYTCSPDNQCEVVCAPANSDSCPDGLICMMVSGPGPGGIQYRCKYSENAGQVGSGAAYTACADTGDCDDGLECMGGFGIIPGQCARACEAPADCTDQPSSGSIEPTCEMISAMPGSEMCVLDCSGDAEGCPDGMICGIGDRCVFQ